MSRDAGVDLVRIIGVLAIVAGHVWEGIWIDRALFSWHVPVFFFLTGYLWRGGSEFREFLKRRSQALLKPYFFWLLAICLFYFGWLICNRNYEVGSWLAPIYGGYYAQQPFTTFWFVFVLLACSVLWFFFEKLPLGICIIYLVAAVLLAPTLGPYLARTPLAVGSALLCVVFLAGGRLAGRARTIRTRVRLPIALVLGSLSFLASLSGVSAPLNLKSGDWGTPMLSVLVAILISWALLELGLVVGSRLIKPVANGVTDFALTGFTIVLVHPFLIWILRRTELADGAVFIAAVVVPLGLGLLALRTPAAPWMTGVSRIRSVRAN